MQRTSQKLSDLETRFTRLSSDGQDCLQSIANWTIQRARSLESPWQQKDQLVDWHCESKRQSIDDISAARTSLLSIVKLLAAIVAEMNSVVANVARGDDAEDLQRLQNFRRRVDAFNKELAVKTDICSNVYSLQDSGKAMVFVSCWLHQPFVSNEEPF
ncbi:hypothetical protein HDU98_006989 [Podochytrium sp. JEL0797]|nr:hypothetical protein HDU98_006989 [Podochytrium sp. JEL0797]